MIKYYFSILFSFLLPRSKVYRLKRRRTAHKECRPQRQLQKIQMLDKKSTYRQCDSQREFWATNSNRYFSNLLHKVYISSTRDILRQLFDVIFSDCIFLWSQKKIATYKSFCVNVYFVIYVCIIFRQSSTIEWISSIFYIIKENIMNTIF